MAQISSLETLKDLITALFVIVSHKIYVDMAEEDLMLYKAAEIVHKLTCHRCGNLRKQTLFCEACPYIFCARCAEKMEEEYGFNAFLKGCPVCLELCCCSDKTVDCNRTHHCYKKCPSQKSNRAKSGSKSSSSRAKATARKVTPQTSNTYEIEPSMLLGDETDLIGLLCQSVSSVESPRYPSRLITPLEHQQIVTTPIPTKMNEYQLRSNDNKNENGNDNSTSANAFGMDDHYHYSGSGVMTPVPTSSYEDQALIMGAPLKRKIAQCDVTDPTEICGCNTPFSMPDWSPTFGNESMPKRSCSSSLDSLEGARMRAVSLRFKSLFLYTVVVLSCGVVCSSLQPYPTSSLS